MKRHAKAPSAGSIDAGGKSRGRLATLLATLALAIFAAALAASPASAAPPIPVMGSVENVSYDSVHLTGTVDSDYTLLYFFQYSTDQVNWTNGPLTGRTIDATSGPVEVNEDLTNLKGGTKYFVRLATFDEVEVFGEVHSEGPNPFFTTLPVEMPTVLSANDATDLSYTTVKVSGEVERPENPDHAFDAHCRFEYVTDAAFQPLDEQQSLTVRASGGTFSLGFEAQTSAPLAFDASASAVEAALEALSSIGSGNVSVSGGPGDEAGAAPYAIAFSGALAAKDLEPISVDASALTGPGEAEVATTAEGRPEGFNNPSQTPCSVDPVEAPQAKEAVPVDAELVDLAPATTYHLRLSASNAGGVDSLEAANTFTTLFAPAPGVSLDPVTDPGPFGADVTSQVNPNDTPTSAYLEYSPDAGVNWIPIGENASLGEGTSPVDFDQTIAGLEPSTDYLLRLRATNIGGETVSDPPRSFTTDPVPPVAQTLSADTGSDEATLAARVNPKNSPVTYQFEWGPVQAEGDETYENKAPATAELLPAADMAFHPVKAQLAGLQPATVYHYRIVAVNTESSVEVKGADRIFTTPPATGPVSCPNEASRVGPSANLPDCRVYEWISPGFNGTFALDGVGSQVFADGNALAISTFDAVDNAEAAETFGNFNLTKRGPDGWSTKSLLPPMKVPKKAFGDGASRFMLLSEDLSQWIVASTQPLAGAGSPSGYNFYLRRADGTFVPITNAGSFANGPASCKLASRDFTHIFCVSLAKQLLANQLEPDPVNEASAYEWVNGDLRLVGILPGAGEAPAPQGANLAGGALPAFSDDGERVLFGANGLPGLYLRTEGSETTEVSVSQRMVDPDPDPNAGLTSVGITGDGSEVLFISKSELTDDANTGETEGVANHQGADLYSYDVQDEDLTDLTVDDNPADAATGANVKQVATVTSDGSYIYFIATGALAPGAISEEENLYVEHEGDIDFIAQASGMNDQNSGLVKKVYLTPDGRHFAFLSRDSLTGYENVNPDSGQPQDELFTYTYKAGLECPSCRPSGEPPTGGASFSGRALSDDGSRVFFQSTDAIVPEDVSGAGVRDVYEYENGKVQLLSAGTGEAPANLLGASASGDDVFFSTWGELSPQGQGDSNAVYDVRVNANVSPLSSVVCQGESCRGAKTSAPALTSAGSANFGAPEQVSVSDSKTVKGPQLRLRIIVPGGGSLTISGKGLKPVKKRVSKPGSLTMVVTLKPAADRTRQKQGVFKTKAQVLFKSSGGDTSRAEVSLKFEAKAKKKGGK